MILYNILDFDLAPPADVPDGAVHVFMASEDSAFHVQKYDAARNEWVELNNFTELSTVQKYAEEVEADAFEEKRRPDQIADELEFLAKSRPGLREQLTRLAHQVRELQ